MARLVAWFQTKNGRTFTKCCVGIAATVAFSIHVVPHGPGVEKTKEIFHMYRHDMPRPLVPKMVSIVEQVMKDCTLDDEEKKKLTFFYSVGTDTFHFGSIKSPWGAIVGIPFIFENIEDVDLGGLKILHTEAIEWLIDGNDLIESFKISDDAKKFALLREIYLCNSFNFLVNGAMNAAFIVMIANFIREINTKLRTFERFRFSNRSLIYMAIYSIGYLVYRCLKDPMKHLSEIKADEKAAETGPEYLNGGIEYYKKLLQKNIALRELPNSEFENSFDAKGNESYTLLAPKLPTSKRLDILKEMKEKMNKT